MTKPVQLKLWVDDPATILVHCPHCGHQFNARPQLTRGRDAILSQVMAHACIRALPMSTRAFLQDAPERFLAGDRVGLLELAEAASLAKGAASYHVKRLVDHHLITPEPKRAGGRYFVYRFNFPNGAKT